ncbi:trypsin-like serine protease [Rhodobacteraceae bacterium]|nr:trypsin-like serine protease [Paracoccaceae bacterium]
MMRRTLGVVAVLALGLTDAALAQTKDRLDRRDKLFGYESVGRLDSQRGQCTAVLIARDVALTAAHCVLGKGNKFVFRMGYSDGAALATRQSEDVVIAPAYMAATAQNDRGGQIGNDVALVRLNSPIYDANTNPFAISGIPKIGTKLTLASYGQGRDEALTLERGCTLQKRYRGGIVEIDCDTTFGSSGAPVFYQTSGRPKLFSIVTSGLDGENGQKVTYTVELTKIVPELMQVLRNRRALAPATSGARRLTVGERSEGGHSLHPTGRR